VLVAIEEANTRNNHTNYLPQVIVVTIVCIANKYVLEKREKTLLMLLKEK